MKIFYTLISIFLLVQSCSVSKFDNSNDRLIDNETGGLYLTKNVFVSTDLSKSELLEEIKDLEYKNETNAEGFSSLIFKNIIKDSIEIELTITFCNEQYCGFNLFFKDNKIAAKLINPKWTDSHEGAQYELYKEWLTQQIGDKENFHWGKIKATRNGMLGIGYITCRVKEYYPSLYYSSGW